MRTPEYKCTECGDSVYKENETCPVCDFLKVDENDLFYYPQNV